jgi:aspartyl protease family protein
LFAAKGWAAAVGVSIALGCAVLDERKRQDQQMRPIVYVCALVIGVGLGLTRVVDNLSSKPANPNPMVAKVTPQPSAPQPATSGGSRSTTLVSDRAGHFQVDARIDGRNIQFIVDTGASMVALRESSAARLGFFPKASDYTVRTQTANGVGRAARFRLNRVEVNGITVYDVEAFVVPDEQLSTNLLGMTFLSRLKWTHDRGRLLLEQ